MTSDLTEMDAAATRQAALNEILSTGQAVRPDVAGLARRGVLVTLSIRRWRAQTTLQFDDLGMTIDDAATRSVLATIMALGKKRLLPSARRSQLEKAEAEGRRVLEKHSLATPWGRFVPVTAYFAWKGENERCQRAYFDLRDALVAEYASVVEQVLTQYRVAAHHAYTVLQQTNPTAVAVYATEADYVAAFCDQIRAHIPSAEIIAATFSYTMTYAYIDVTPPLPTTTDGLPPRLEFGQTPTEADLQARALAAMESDVVQAMRARKEAEVDRFLTDLVAQLRGLIYDVATDVLTSIQRNKKMPRASTKQLKNMMAQISRLNFYADGDVDRMLAQLQATITLPARQRDIGAVTEQLRAIATITRSSLMQIGETPRSGREVEIPDLPSGTEVQRARHVLQLDAELDLDLAMTPTTSSRGQRQVQLDFGFDAAAAMWAS